MQQSFAAQEAASRHAADHLRVQRERLQFAARLVSEGCSDEDVERRAQVTLNDILEMRALRATDRSGGST